VMPQAALSLSLIVMGFSGEQLVITVELMVNRWHIIGST